MSKESITWGFLACGFLAPGTGILYGHEHGIAVGLIGAAVWCMALAFARWTSPTSGE